MARFLCTVYPIVGHFYPQLAIAQALRARGHECAFYTGDKLAPILKSEGFPHFPFRKVDQERLFQTLFSPAGGHRHWTNALRFRKVLQQAMLDTIPDQVEDLEPILRDWRPDAIYTDPTFWSPVLVFREKAGIPVAISSFNPACMIPGPEAPPFGLGFPRPRSWATRLLHRGAYLAQSFVARKMRRAAGAIRRRYGLPRLQTSILAFTGTVPLYLVPGVPEFDFQRRDLPACVHYVGPLFRMIPPSEKPPEWLTRLSRGRPWVYATEGTVHVTEPVVLRATALGLAGLPLEVILITGDDRDPAQLNLGPLSSNVHVERWVSYPDVLPHTSVVITTGGPGSVLGALCAGVPVIVVPTEWDKPEVAQRVVDSGVGVSLSPRRCTPRALRDAVERLLGDESFRRNAQRLGQILNSYGGPARAAELLEELALTRRQAGSPKSL
jgi:MGT family glycosyltransferase